MKVVCIVPARGGSKGLPLKNLRDLGGKPLVTYPLLDALAVAEIDLTVLTSDDKKILDCGEKLGVEVIAREGDELCGDNATTEVTLKHALLSIELRIKQKFDVCVFLTCTDVFRKVEWVSACINALLADPTLDSAFVVRKTNKNFWCIEDGQWCRAKDWMGTYQNRQFKKNFLYREDTGLASATRASFWREGRRLGDKCLPIPVDGLDVDIHTIEDLVIAEHLLPFWDRGRG